MARTYPFDNFPERYDAWFQKHEGLYRLELKALRMLMPEPCLAIEVGMGSGKFAAPLGIRFGIEPSMTMAKRAKASGLEPVLGIAENLPIRDTSTDLVLLVTTICFVDDITATFLEVRRILKPRGSVLIGFVDKDSHLGEKYLERKDKNIFYKEATFFSGSEVLSLLQDTGFEKFQMVQTILPDDDTLSKVEDGYGKGGFVVIRAQRPAVRNQQCHSPQDPFER